VNSKEIKNNCQNCDEEGKINQSTNCDEEDSSF